MKKLFNIILIILMSLLMTVNVYADEDHIVLDDYSNYLSEDDYKQLNDDLARIEERYDINIYFLIDNTISADNLKSYASSYLDNHSRCKNNIILAISNDSYVLLANGNSSNDVSEKSEEIFRSYNNVSRYVDGIRNYYQKVVEIVNAKNYTSGVPLLDEATSVYDGAGLLSSSQLNELKSRLDAIKKKYGVDVVIATANDLNGMDVEDYADDFYDYNDYGKDGALLLIAMDERDWYLATSGKAIDYFSYDGIESIANDMIDDMVDGKYYEAFNIFADQAEAVIANGGDEIIIEPDNKNKESDSFSFSISAFIASIVTAITGGVLKGQMKNTRKQRYAQNYIVDRSFVLTGRSDMLVDSKVSRTRRHRDDDRGVPRGGGGSPIHTSSSGTSHGGHGGKF